MITAQLSDVIVWTVFIVLVPLEYFFFGGSDHLMIKPLGVCHVPISNPLGRKSAGSSGNSTGSCSFSSGFAVFITSTTTGPGPGFGVGAGSFELCLLQQSKNEELAMEYLTFVSNHKVNITRIITNADFTGLCNK